VLALALGAVAAWPLPAGAQWFGGSQYEYGQRPYRPPPQHGFFGSFPFFGSPGGGGPGGGGGGDQFNPFYRPAQPAAPVESYKAPPPKKYDTPPASTVLVVGDSMADWLAYGLEDVLADTPDVGVVRNIHPNSGLVRYDPKNEALDWAGAVKDSLADQKPSAIVVMLGLSDRLPLRDKPPAPQEKAQDKPQEKLQEKPQDKAQDKPQEKPQDKTSTANPAKPDSASPPAAANEPQRPGQGQAQAPAGPFDFHTDKWAELYSKRIDDMIAALKSKGVPVFWVGLPAVYGTKSTSDMSYLDDLFRARAEHAGIVYVDVWDGFVDESGRYVIQGPDFEGQIRRLRTGDGVHFTKFGADKLAQYVVQELRRAMASRTVPVSLPMPESAAPKPGNGQRPAVGPVLPLAADSGSSDGNNLIGAGGGAAPVNNADPVVTRVLTHGDPIAAPSGRADDFSWPRPKTDAGPTAEAAPDLPASAPQAAPAKAAPGNVKKSDDANKKAGAAGPAAPVAPGPARRSPSASLDGAPPRPPAPVSGGF
jgi:hypothetical protein